MTDPISSPPAQMPGEGDGIYYSDPIPNRPLAGNTSDDDGIALDEFFEAMDVGPETYSIPPAPRETIKPTTRLITRSLPFQQNIPLMLLAADPRRKSLHLYFHDPAGNSGTVIQVGSDGPSAQAGAYLLAGGEDGTGTKLYQVYDLSDHTGPLWVNTPNNSVVENSVIAVAVTE